MAETVDFPLSGTELRILRIWGETTMQGGHWGDGNIVLPDESNLIARLGNVPVALTRRDFDILRIWLGASSHTPEEETLEARVRSMLAQIPDRAG
jgi:hypothetical protein